MKRERGRKKRDSGNSSEKQILEDEWMHTSIILRPNSFDPKYKNIVVDQSNAKEMRIVGVFVQILE